MKPAKPADAVEDDQKPLLYPTLHGQVAVAADEVRLHEQMTDAPVAERRWEGHLLQCCGSCDSTGWLSCLFSRYLPCIAFGTNVKRGFRSSAWLHGLLFLVLFGLAYWVWVVLGAAGHNVLASCNGPLPHPPHEHPPHEHLLPHHRDPLDIWGPEGLLGGLIHHLDEEPHWHPEPHKPEDDKDVFVYWGPYGKTMAKHHHDDDDDNDDDDHHDHHESDGSDGDHHHKHGDKHKDKDKSKKIKKGDRKILPGATLNLDLVKPEQPAATANAFTSVSTFEDRPEEQPRQLQADFFTRPEDGPDAGPQDYSATPECRQAMGIYFGVWIALIASVLVAVHYAARRRTLLRMKFGIAGSRLSDFCTWFWCGSCALCQETRTLWVNQVEEGEWRGPAKLGYTAVPTLPLTTNQPPTAQFMTTGV